MRITGLTIVFLYINVMYVLRRIKINNFNMVSKIQK